MDFRALDKDLYHLRMTRGLSEKEAATLLGISDEIADKMALQYRIDERAALEKDQIGKTAWASG